MNKCMELAGKGLGAALWAGFLAATMASTVLGQEAANYPRKPVTIVLSNQGPGIDSEMRLYLDAMRQQGGPSYLIDYKIGGGNGVAMSYVAKAQPDGYTLLGAVASLITVPAINDMGFDNVRDFTPITLTSKRFFMLLVHPDLPVRTLKDYIDYARNNPGKLNFSTAGVGSSTHMPGELLHSMTNTKVTFVHYKASNQRLLDLLAGRVDVTVGTPLTSAGYVTAGKMRGIGITGSVRSRSLPDIPTIAESGLPDYEYSTWAGLLAPARVPQYVVTKNLELFRAASKHPDVQRKFSAEETYSVMSTSEEFRQFIISENRRWGKIIKDVGIKIED